MAKKQSNKTQSKELKPDIQDKKEISKPFPTSKMVQILLFSTNKEYSLENSTAKAIIVSKRGKLV